MLILLDLGSLLPKVDAKTENWIQVAYLQSQEAGHVRAGYEIRKGENLTETVVIKRLSLRATKEVQVTSY